MSFKIWENNNEVSYGDFITNDIREYGNLFKKRDLKDIENYILEHYDMSLKELDEFIMKYEPERTV